MSASTSTSTSSSSTPSTSTDSPPPSLFPPPKTGVEKQQQPQKRNTTASKTTLTQKQPGDAASRLADSYERRQQQLNVLLQRRAPFELYEYPKPHFMLPNRSLWRGLWSRYSVFKYRNLYESYFTESAFMEAAIDACTFTGECIASGRVNTLYDCGLFNKPIFDQLLLRSQRLSDADLELFRFGSDDCHHCFIAYSSLKSHGRTPPEMLVREDLLNTFSIMFVSYIVRDLTRLQNETNAGKRLSIAKLLKHHSNRTLIANILFSRPVHPNLTLWKVTDLNFFQPPKSTGFMFVN